MDVFYLHHQTNCIFDFNLIHYNHHHHHHHRPVSIIPRLNHKHSNNNNALRSFNRNRNICFASLSSDILVSGPSLVTVFATNKHKDFKEAEEEDLKSWMHKNGLPPCKVVLKDRPAYDSRHPSTHYVVASQDLHVFFVTLERVLGNETIAELLTTNKLSELACLALYLIYEKKQGNESIWFWYKSTI